MLNLSTLSVCLQSVLCGTKIAQLHDLITCFLSVSHGVTTKSLSRYSEYSRRTLFRFLGGSYEWVSIRVRLFASFIWCSGDAYLLVADETVEGKSRKSTYGIDKFYSSLVKQPISGVCFFGISLVNVRTATSHFIGISQVVKTTADIERIAVAKTERKAGKARSESGTNLPKGRKAGTTPKAKTEPESCAYRTFKPLFIKVLAQLRSICQGIKVTYLVVDNAYGTSDYAALAKAQGLHLLSKFKCNTALYLPYTGIQKGKRPKQYGDKVDMMQLDTLLPSACKKIETKDGYTHSYYQFQAYAKNAFGVSLLNIVVMRTIRLKDNKVATNIWFTTDLTLDYETLLHYYHLRFQIEFEFRDAKQYFGLSDFKNYKKEHVTNFVELIATMCLVSKIYVAQFRQLLHAPKLSVLDLKLIFNARFNAKNLIKFVRKQGITISFDHLVDHFLPTNLINYEHKQQ
jgi:hypothetical protein